MQLCTLTVDCPKVQSNGIDFMRRKAEVTLPGPKLSCVGYVRWQTRCSADCSRQALLAAEQQPQLGAELKHLGGRSEGGGMLAGSAGLGGVWQLRTGERRRE